MRYLDINLEKLKENNEYLYNKIKKIIKKGEYDFNKFEILNTKNGQKTIEIENDEKKIRLNSLYNPDREAIHWLEKINFKNLDAPILMFGIGNGIFIRKILSKLSEESDVFLYEPDISLFIFCLIKFDMTDIFSDRRVNIFIEEVNYDKFYDTLEIKIGAIMLNTQIVCSHPEMEALYPKQSLKFVNDIKKIFTQREWDYNNIVVLAEASVENTLKNLHFIKESNYVTDFEDIIPKDIPFIIVAAGPSLDKNVVELKKAVGKSFILATDRAVKTLLENDIDFDAVITLDATKGLEYMGGDIKKIKKYPIFAGIDAKNEVLETIEGRKIFILSTNFLPVLYNKHNINMKIYKIGGSVATAAFNVARAIGMKNVILVGQDLAYLGDSTHAGGIADCSNNNQLTTYVEGIDGKKIKTRQDWVLFLKWFEKAIEEEKDKIRVIDATEGGAKIEGTEIMKLSVAIERFCDREYDFKRKLRKVKPTFSREQYLDVKCDLMHMKDEIEIIKRCVSKGIDATDTLYKLVDSEEKNNDKKYECSQIIKNMNDIIEKQLVYILINMYIKKYTDRVMRGVNCIFEDENENMKNTCFISKHVYKCIEYTLERLEKILDDSLETI